MKKWKKNDTTQQLRLPPNSELPAVEIIQGGPGLQVNNFAFVARVAEERGYHLKGGGWARRA
jgi:hypothetical protein